MEYDCAIIGGGPAGVTASIYACRAGMNVLSIEKLFEGGQLASIHAVENYPGLFGADGNDLIDKFVEHAGQYERETVNGEVLKIEKNEDVFAVYTENKSYAAKTVIIATGAKPRKLGAPGEEEFTGRGVSYCAVCDGAFYRNKATAIIGGGNTAAQDALYLSRICDKVYLIHRRDRLRAEKYFIELIEKNEGVEIIYDTVLEEIHGDKNVEGVRIKNVKTSEISQIKTDGVFIAAGIVPESGFVKGLLKLDESGFIITDECMRTNISGIYAAGDVRTTPLRQIVTACADGAVAANQARGYLDM